MKKGASITIQDSDSKALLRIQDKKRGAQHLNGYEHTQECEHQSEAVLSLTSSI